MNTEITPEIEYSNPMETIAGIKYSKPTAILLNESGLGIAEFAGRTAYNSFDKTENEVILNLNDMINGSLKLSNNYDFNEILLNNTVKDVRDIKNSKLLEQLAHVYHHDSVLEHITLSYLVKGFSRGVLQEISRHRIGISPTVQSTRYTMTPILNAFIACYRKSDKKTFFEILNELDFLVINNESRYLEYTQLWGKLSHQLINISNTNEDSLDYFLSKSQKEILNNYVENNSNFSSMELFYKLQEAKAKRNVGDNFKWIVTDNWKVDAVYTINLRALSHLLKLRDSGAAYFQARWFAEALIKITPQKYLKLIDKKYI